MIPVVFSVFNVCEIENSSDADGFTSVRSEAAQNATAGMIFQIGKLEDITPGRLSAPF